MSWLTRKSPAALVGGIGALFALSSFLIGSYAQGNLPWFDRRPLRERYPVCEVIRTDLAPILSAPGRLESAKRTVIRCQLENMAGTAGGSASTMLSVVPEGTNVKQGDLLATLDASNYEELQRQQVITVEQAKASHLQAELDLEIALLAVREYRDGIVEETLKGMEGSLAMARSDLSRAAEHLNWTEKMSGKGYSSLATDHFREIQRVANAVHVESPAHGNGLVPEIHPAEDRENPSAPGRRRADHAGE